MSVPTPSPAVAARITLAPPDRPRPGDPAGVGAGVGFGVDDGVAVGVGVAVGRGVGVAVGRGVAVGVGVGPGLGVGVLRGVGVACATLVGFAVGLPGVNGVAEWDGAIATDGGDVAPGALGCPNRSDVIHKSNPATVARRTSRRSNHMSGTPPTHY